MKDYLNNIQDRSEINIFRNIKEENLCSNLTHPDQKNSVSIRFQQRDLPLLLVSNTVLVATICGFIRILIPTTSTHMIRHFSRKAKETDLRNTSA
jgi:hypothetical protein